MENPALLMLQLQAAWFQNWLTLCNGMLKESRHMLDMQQQFFDHPTIKRWHDICVQDADFTTHYGHRAHDVDVEKI